jgi:hypothetical protein
VKIVGDVLTRPIVLKSRQILLCWLPGRRPDVSTAAKHGTGQWKDHVVDLRRAAVLSPSIGS